jgi:hypothetical protein
MRASLIFPNVEGQFLSGDICVTGDALELISTGPRVGELVVISGLASWFVSCGQFVARLWPGYGI